MNFTVVLEYTPRSPQDELPFTEETFCRRSIPFTFNIKEVGIALVELWDFGWDDGPFDEELGDRSFERGRSHAKRKRRIIETKIGPLVNALRKMELEESMANLNGKIALVTGGSRGLGQGIALVLGEHGCTVYVTGRSTKEDSQRPEWPNATIDKTAQLVTEMGGKGIPIQCDHTDDDQVNGVYEQIKEEKGYIDILVNVIWGGYDNMENFSKPFWDQPNWRIDKMYQTGVRTSYTACRIGAKLMLPRKQGLIINITFWDQDKYLEPVPQDFALTAMGRLMFAMAQELKPHNIASIALSPGFIRNEGMLSQEEIRGEYQRPPVVSQNLPPKTESTQYAGRAVVALACDPDIISRTGQVLNVGNLSREYGFTDIDGTQPPPYQIEWTGKP